MIIKEYLKFTLFSEYAVIRTRKVGNHFEIKRLKSEATPIWVVWYAADSKDLFDFYYSMVRDSSIDITKGLTVSDMNKIQQQGFRILRSCNTPCICIKERKPTGTWCIAERFATKHLRSFRLSELTYQKDVFLAD